MRNKVSNRTRMQKRKRNANQSQKHRHNAITNANQTQEQMQTATTNHTHAPGASSSPSLLLAPICKRRSAERRRGSNHGQFPAAWLPRSPLVMVRPAQRADESCVATCVKLRHAAARAARCRMAVCDIPPRIRAHPAKTNWMSR